MQARQNVAKSQTMMFQPGALRSGMLEDAVGQVCMGVGASYHEQLLIRIPWTEWGVELNAESMKAHKRRMHGTYPEIYRNRLPTSQTEHLPQVYDARFLNGTTQWPWTFPGWPGSSWTWNGLRNSFNCQHWGDRIIILDKHPTPFPKCDLCRSQVPLWRLNSFH